MPSVTPTLASPTVTSTPDTSFPAWINTPENPVVVAITPGYFATFFNIHTQEKYDYQIDGYTPRMNWLHHDNQTSLQILYGNILNGRAGYTLQLNIETGETTSDELVTSFIWLLHGDSLVQTYQTTQITNITTGKITPLPDPFHGTYPSIGAVAWSSTGNLLAINRYVRFEEGQRPDGVTRALIIYTPAGDVYRIYPDVSARLWSPTSDDFMLFSRYDGTDTPAVCIINIQTSNINCLDTLIDWLNAKGMRLDRDQLQWAPDGQKISFAYSDEYQAASGLCYLTVATDEIFCPYEAVQAEWSDATYVVEHAWSPDGQYLSLLLNSCVPVCHDRGMTFLSTMTNTGEEFQILGHTLGKGLWRPDFEIPLTTTE